MSTNIVNQVINNFHLNINYHGINKRTNRYNIMSWHSTTAPPFPIDMYLHTSI
jgi:hypothetical protein